MYNGSGTVAHISSRQRPTRSAV